MKASLLMGILAILLILIPANTFFLSVPSGILAVMYEKQAIKNDATKTNLNAIGKIPGKAALICF